MQTELLIKLSVFENEVPTSQKPSDVRACPYVLSVRN